MIRLVSRSSVYRIQLLLTCVLGPGVLLSPREAVGSPSNITVTTTADELNTDGDCSLREAVRAANLDTAVDACSAGSGADTIIVPAGTYLLTLGGASENAALTGDLDLAGTVTLLSSATPPPIIDGQGLDRVLDVQAGAFVTISGITLQNGMTPLGENGGGIRNRGTLLLKDSLVRTSIAQKNASCCEPSDGGGGIINDGGRLTLNGSAVRGNTSGEYGGGILNWNGTLILRTSTVSKNTSTFHGAGLWNVGTATLTMSSVSGNIGGRNTWGAGIFNRGGTLTVVDSTVRGNSCIR